MVPCDKAVVEDHDGGQVVDEFIASDNSLAMAPIKKFDKSTRGGKSWRRGSFAKHVNQRIESTLVTWASSQQL